MASSTAGTAASPAKHVSLLWLMGPPLVALAAARFASALVAKRFGFDPLRADSWIRWDSYWYLQIAERGYQLQPCPGGDSNLCGGTGWFPGYPTLISAFARAGIPPAPGGIAIALIAQLVLLVLLWGAFLDALPSPRNLAALLLAAFFPGAIYYQALFPISTFLCFGLGFLLACIRGRWWIAAACGAGALFTYPTGFLLGGVYALWLLISMPEAQRDWHRLLPIAGPLVGFAAVFWIMAAQTGVWDAFIKTQAGFGYGLSDPLGTLSSRLAPLTMPRTAKTAALATAGQTLLVLVLVIGASWVALRERSRLEMVLLGLYTVVYWSFPLILGGQLSLYRAEALLLPMVVLLAQGPPALLLAGMACALFLFLPMAQAFFQGVLV